MAIKVFLGRTIAEVDSTAEAVELAKLWNDGAQSPQMELPLSEPDAITKLLGQITARPKKLLRALLDFPDGTEGPKISEVIKQPTTAFGGLLGAVSKKAEKFGLKPDDIFISEMRNSGLKRYRFMAPGKLLIKYSDLVLGSGEPSWKEEARRVVKKIEGTP